MIEFGESNKPKGYLSFWGVPCSITEDDLSEELILNPEAHGCIEIDPGQNMVVDLGRQSSAMEKAGEWALDPVTTFCVGTGGYSSPPVCDTPPSPALGTDTDLYALVDSRPLQSIVHPNIAANTYVAFIGANELNGMSFSEWGLKMASGKLYSRRTTKPYPKEAAFAILVKWTVQH